MMEKSFIKWAPGDHLNIPVAHPTNDISLEFENRPKFAVLWFKMYSTDLNGILHTSRHDTSQLGCVRNIVVIG